MMDAIDVTLPAGGFQPTRAVEAVRGSGIPRQLEQLASGPFGQTSTNLRVLEGLAEAVDLGLSAGQSLEATMLEEDGRADSLALPELSAAQKQLVATFGVVVLADTARRTIEQICGLPAEGASMDTDGLADLLEARQPEHERLERALRLANGWLAMKSKSGELGGGAEADGQKAARALAAFFGLIRRSVIDYTDQSRLRPLVDALKARRVTVADHPYRGLEIRERTDDRSGLRPVRPDDIVGNRDYLDAGLRLARDVAGYDLQAGRNPKQVNPVLFGLGRPGSGKTFTAHAIGNYFLDFCQQRGVPARFRVVRRTDWASSYQNASARNLLDIFQEEVYDYDGVCGVYWPDIDTAFASRSSSGLRMEEKQNLGAVFGVFDGTLLPKDGSWFLICDANTLHMDDATVSRIAQNPMRVEGPTDPDHYIELIRDIQFADVADFIPDGEEAWSKIGGRAADLDLTGRNIESICRNIRTTIQDFDYPDRYFEADSAERNAIVRDLSNPVDADQIVAEIDDWHAFHRSEQERADEEQFQQKVSSIVQRLNS